MSSNSSSTNKDSKKLLGNSKKVDNSDIASCASSSWHNVWEATDRLEAKATTFYPDVTPRVIQILRDLAAKWDGDPEWRSLLDKRSLYHELEESIVALHYLLLNIQKQSSSSSSSVDEEEEEKKQVTVVDACAGKGFFSFLLAYLKPSNVCRIVLLEKATNINWHHIHMANQDDDDDDDGDDIDGDENTSTTRISNRRRRRPPISIWSDTNLHDYDNVLQRLLDFEKSSIAMVGIHLCKQLSPSFCGLVNGLGSKCIYACLAPCCLPRAVTSQKHNKNKNNNNNNKYSLQIQLPETPDQRSARIDYMERRERAKRKSSAAVGPCYHCQDPTHLVKECPVIKTLPRDEQIQIGMDYHRDTIPCWNCLELGHYKMDCPMAVERSNPVSMPPPYLRLDVSHVLASEHPFKQYCHILSQSLQGLAYQHCQVLETDLVQDSSKHQQRQKQDVVEHDTKNKNWNGQRKSIFIVVTT
jgi:hypothetical protein